MKTIGFQELEKRLFLLAFNSVPPQSVDWSTQFDLSEEQGTLFATNLCTYIEPTSDFTQTILKRAFYPQFEKLVKKVLCHRDLSKYHHLYSLFSQLLMDQRAISDPLNLDLKVLKTFDQQVGRDVHKMHAFVRFNKFQRNGQEVFVAKHRPDHYILRPGSALFVERFPNMNWMIFSQDELVVWDQKILHHKQGDFSHLSIEEDDFTELWGTYFSSIFNPARVKLKAMKKEMPKRYWENMPETRLIDSLVKDAPNRVSEMINQTPAKVNMESFTEGANLRNLNLKISQCTACHLKCEKQIPVSEFKTEYLFISYRPLDNSEKIKVFSEAYRAGISSYRVSFTTVNKHEPTGHAKDQLRAMMICRSWLVKEIELKCPEVVVCLDPKAAHAVFGYPLEKDELNKSHQTQVAPITIPIGGDGKLNRSLMNAECLLEDQRVQFQLIP